MPTLNENIIPASTGLTIGNANQMWIAYVEDLFVDTVVSNSPNGAAIGTIRLSSTDTISWRNAANSADVSLSKTDAASSTTPADTLVWGGAGIEGPFISNQLNPAATGQVRLAPTDVINFRNTANTGDIAALTHNSDDTITVGDSAGISTGGNLTITGNETVAGALSVAGQLTAPSILATSIITATSTNLSISGANASFSIPGANVTIASGAQGAGAAAGTLFLNGGAPVSPGGTGKISSNTSFIAYNGITLVDKGLPSAVAAVNITAQTAAINTTTLYAVPTANSGGPGQYRLSWNAKITTAAGTSSTLGALTIVYTDPDGVAVTLTAAAIIAAGTVATTSAGNTTGTVLIGIPQLLNCGASTNITYAFAYASNAANAMNYNLHILLEAC